MPTINLEVPSAGQNIAAGLHAANYADLQALLNGGLDGSNLSTVPPAKLTGYPADGARILKGDGTWGYPTLELIEQKTGSAISWSSISQAYTHLKIVGWARSALVASTDVLRIRINGVATASYYTQYSVANAASNDGNELLGHTWGFVGTMPGNNASPALSVVEILLPVYTSAVSKAWMGESFTAYNNSTGTLRKDSFGGYVSNTSPITSLSLHADGGTFNAATSFSLYGIR